jgi:hypothetical protein
LGHCQLVQPLPKYNTLLLELGQLGLKSRDLGIVIKHLFPCAFALVVFPLLKNLSVEAVSSLLIFAGVTVAFYLFI